MAQNAIHCPYHPNAVLIEDYRAGDQICSECGLVVGDRVIDVSIEWVIFGNERILKNRIDSIREEDTENPLLENSDLSMLDGPSCSYKSDNKSDTITYKNTFKMYSKKRTLSNLIREIDIMADRVNLSKRIVDRARVLVKEVNDCKHLKFRSNDSIASAILFTACKEERQPRTFKEISAISRISENEIYKVSKLIKKALQTTADSEKTEDLILKFCCKLKLSETVKKLATHIARKTVEHNIVPGHSIISVTAAAVFMAFQESNEKRSIQEIANIVGVTEPEIERPYKLMLPVTALLLPEDLKFVPPIF